MKFPIARLAFESVGLQAIDRHRPIGTLGITTTPVLLNRINSITTHSHFGCVTINYAQTHFKKKIWRVKSDTLQQIRRLK